MPAFIHANRCVDTPLSSALNRKLKQALFFLCASMLIIPAFPTPSNSQAKLVVGWIENVNIYPGNLYIRAKMDTGAKNSSLNAAQIKKFERNGEIWVHFSVIDRKGKKFNFEKKVLRDVKIKEHGSEPDMRPAIILGICLGTVFKEVEVNLEDRSKFNYQMLIGRSFLKNSFIVDPSAIFTTKPKCEGVPAN